MKTILSIASVVTALLVAAPPAHGQAPTIASDLLKDWQAQKQTMMKIADAMPAEKFDYKSTPAQRNYGEQILHVAGANYMLMKFVGAKNAPAPPPLAERDLSTFGLKATSKAEILKLLSDSYDYGEAVIKEFTAAQMLETIQGPPWIREATRAKMVYYTLGHTQDIYGQMAVYLRLNGLVPPASQRGI